MVAGVFSAKTPEYCVAIAVEIHGFVTLCIVAAATGTDRLTATVVVGHEVIAIVYRIAAGADPGNR